MFAINPYDAQLNHQIYQERLEAIERKQHLQNVQSSDTGIWNRRKWLRHITQVRWSQSPDRAVSQPDTNP